MLPRLGPLPIKERLSLLFLEKGNLDVLDGAFVLVAAGGVRTHIPVGGVACLMLEPGTRVSHAAVILASRCGTLLIWTGEAGVRMYAAGQPGGARSDRLLYQAGLALDPKARLDVVRAMFALRFGEEPPDRRSVEQLRGLEGARVKRLYELLAHGRRRLQSHAHPAQAELPPAELLADIAAEMDLREARQMIAGREVVGQVGIDQGAFLTLLGRRQESLDGFVQGVRSQGRGRVLGPDHPRLEGQRRRAGLAAEVGREDRTAKGRGQVGQGARPGLSRGPEAGGEHPAGQVFAARKDGRQVLVGFALDELVTPAEEPALGFDLARLDGVVVDQRRAGRVHGHEGDVGRGHVAHVAGQQVLGFHPHSDLHGGAAHGVDRGLEQDELAHAHRLDEVDPVHGHGHGVGPAVAHGGHGPGHVDVLHDHAAVHRAEGVGVLGLHHLREHEAALRNLPAVHETSSGRCRRGVRRRPRVCSGLVFSATA